MCVKGCECYFVFATNSLLILWWMDDGCVRWLLQKTNRNTVSSSSTAVGFAGLETSHFKMYCSLLIQKFTIRKWKASYYYKQGARWLSWHQKVHWSKPLGIIAIVTFYFMQTQLHCCFTWYLYLLCLEFYILSSPLHKENCRLALKTIKIDVWL